MRPTAAGDPPHRAAGASVMVNWTFLRQVGYGRWLVRTAIRQAAKARSGKNALRLPNGLVIELPCDNPSAGEVFVTRANMDWGAEHLLIRYLDAGGCFLDVGANIGYYALLAARAVRVVYAFEPDPRNWPALERNAAVAGNIEIVRAAVYSDRRDMMFDVAGNPAVSRLVPDGHGAASRMRVQTTTLDHFVAEGPDLAVTGIKIDVEGADLAVLRGAREVLVRQAPLVLTEFGIRGGGGNDVCELFRLTASLGYEVFAPLRMVGHGGTPRFARLDSHVGLIGPDRYKMLFLVPRRLAARFAELVTR
jgi:FkbM family methyltransferase